MNASQLLEVSTKVFVNQGQEDQWEANRKMKRKVDLLAVAFVEQSGRPWDANHGRERGNPCGWQSVPLEQTHPREEIRQDQCAYCCQEGHWKGPGTPRSPPRPEAEAKLLKESISLLRGEGAPGRKTLSGWPL
jgi:hypothetical protein